MTAGTVANFGHFAVTIGKAFTLYPLSAYGYTFPAGPASGALPCSGGPVIAVVMSASLPNLPGRPYRAKVKIIAPGTPNNNQIIPIDAETIAD